MMSILEKCILQYCRLPLVWPSHHLFVSPAQDILLSQIQRAVQFNWNVTRLQVGQIITINHFIPHTPTLLNMHSDEIVLFKDVTSVIWLIWYKAIYVLMANNV